MSRANTTLPVGIRAEFSEAPCSSDPQLFDATTYDEHVQAREVCAGCLNRQVCYDVALADRSATGTHGGALFVRGRVQMEIRP